MAEQVMRDMDGDGIPDADDQCPLEDATGLDADKNGCIDTPNDLDGDGIVDLNDIPLSTRIAISLQVYARTAISTVTAR